MTAVRRNSENGKTGLTHEVLNYISRLSSGSHAILHYDDNEALVQAFNAYVAGGVAKGEATHIVVPTIDAYSRLSEKLDDERGELEKTNKLTYILLSDFAVDNGRLSPNKAHQSRLGLVEADRQLGFKGTRILGLSDYYLDFATPSEKLEFESGSALLSNFPITSFCCYNAPKLLSRNLHEFLIKVFEKHNEIIGKTSAWPRGGSP